ncbi:MAG: hypothetical protein LUQ65_06835 [Candidatus Helarchaeota archaeon]|nr:hypothetical protein [Candidatus Helarchaeota archaeon]
MATPIIAQSVTNHYERDQRQQAGQQNEPGQGLAPTSTLLNYPSAPPASSWHRHHQEY